MMLSVIVAAYNAEKTLRRCVESIVAQHVGDMEVILVNDGSTDKSGDIARQLEGENSQVRLISQENRGLSEARNTGIEASSGEYITFVDSDDWIMDNTYPTLLHILGEHPDCDILEYKPVADRLCNVEYDVTEPHVYSSAREYWLQGKAYQHTYACNKIFRRTLLFSDNGANVRFPKGKLFEDVWFLSSLLARNPRVLVTPQEGYVYCYNADGITANIGAKGFADLLEGHVRAAELLQMDFTRHDAKTVTAEETEYYLAVLNIQISACRHGKTPLSLPKKRINLTTCPRKPKTMAKVILLNLFGIKIFQRCFI